MSTSRLPILETDPSHFIRAVTDLGSQRPVITTQAIFNVHGIKVLENGTAIQPNLYDRLMQHRLSAPLEDCVTSVPSITSAIVQESVAQALERVPLYERMFGDIDSRALLLESVARIPLPNAIAFQLTLACEMRPKLYAHLIDTALVAGWLAMDPPQPSHARVVHATTVGLLHDIGMLHLDPVLLDYRQEIDQALQRELWTHPIISHLLADHQHVYPKDVLQGILDHHEFMDGSGYPRALSAHDLGPMARILALTELVAGANANGRMLTEHRLSVMLRMTMHRYDHDLAKRVLELLRPYPEVIGSTRPLLDNPAAHLLAIHAVLAQWPQQWSAQTTPTERHSADFAFIADQVLGLQHNLARVGAAPEHLDQLGDTQPDRILHTELTLLVEEATWQLRAIERQTRQRWHGEEGHELPAHLAQWLQRVNATVANCNLAVLPSSG
jgi:hypothetical protein